MFYSGIFFFISSTILKAAGQIATFFKVKSAICYGKYLSLFSKVNRLDLKLLIKHKIKL
jgi:hypothetical protein